MRLLRLQSLWPIFCLLLTISASPQTQLISSHHFPAEFEFKELAKILDDRRAEGGDALKALPDGDILLEAGMLRRDERVYETGSGEKLQITISRFADPAGARSVFTLYRSGPEGEGPPGDRLELSDGLLAFAQGVYWVRIQGCAEDLRRRVAVSVANRIGASAQPQPALPGQLPPAGLDATSVRYFLGPLAYRRWAQPVAGEPLSFQQGMQIAQARYRLDGGSGVLSLISFPTVQMAEDFYDRLGESARAGVPAPARVYARRTGLLVGILGGDLDSTRADRILDGIRYRYTVRWIYDKNSSRGKTLWGIPVGVLSTVVRSLAFTALLCVASILFGGCAAFLRLALRKHRPNNYFDDPERSGLIRLRLMDAPGDASHGTTSARQEGAQ